jgi:hypothetical protein
MWNNIVWYVKILSDGYKMKKIFLVTAVVLALFQFCSNIQAATYSGGTGTQTDPYLIATAADINTLGSTSADWSKCFKMIADINMAEYSGTKYKIIGDGSPFTGVFDGNEHKIYKLKYTTTNDVSCIGIFGYASDAIIKNLGVEDVNLSASSESHGALIGFASYCTISNCYSIGKVTSSATSGNGVGGLIGYLIDGSLYNCHSSSTVTSNIIHAGGLIGFQNGGTIKNCYSMGQITHYTSSSAFAGGLVGIMSNGTTIITNCYSTANVSSQITTAHVEMGGLVGNSFGRITNSYATGTVSGGYYAGGLVGINHSAVINCYSTGEVSGTYRVGGLMGANYNSTTKNCFWDQETSLYSTGVGYGNSIGITGKTIAEMKSLTTYVNAGWSIGDIYEDDAVAWIMMSDGSDYPKLQFFFWQDRFSANPPFLGDGTESDPYQINSAEDFYALGNYPAAWGKYIILTTDINMAGYPVIPIGNAFYKFTGSFDGQRFTIRNVTMNFPEKNYVGLFGRVSAGGVISDLGIEDINIAGKKLVGGLAGYNSGGIFSNCYVTGLLKPNSSACVGGLVGYSTRGTISRCNSDVNISGACAAIGGLAGCNGKKNVIINCYAAGSICDVNFSKFNSSAGGLVGSNMGTIQDSYTDCNIAATFNSSSAYFHLGDIVGDNYYGLISHCYSTGDVSVISNSSTALINAGGITGFNIQADINDCYSTGQIAFNCDDESQYLIGGIAGGNIGKTINRCYSTCAIGSGSSPETDYGVGGAVGINLDGFVSGCFWDIQTSGKTLSGGGKGLTTEQMKTMLIYQNAGWTDNGWVMNDGMDYPRLAWENTEGVAIGAEQLPPLTGNGTAADPYQIWTAADFAYLSWYKSIIDKHFILMADIDLQNIRIHPIGEFGPFTGTFDGNGHLIKNICIYEPANSHIGVFSRIGTGGVVKNLGIHNANIVGADRVGGLIGKNEGGTVSRCYSTGTVDALSDAGGLIGKIDSGTVDNSYSSSGVTVWPYSNKSVSYGGGLVGNVDSGTISKCYSVGLVLPTSSSYTGGLIGRGTSATVTNCFWDANTSGKTTSAGGTGALAKTTTHMQSAYTFLNAGWDFLGETYNGTQDIWTIFTGYNPCLAWQVKIATPDLSGMTQTQAENTIIASGLKVGTITNIYSNTVPKGYIISQSPTAGTIRPYEHPVNIMVSFNNGGDGSNANPYQIADNNGLLALAATPTEYNKCFVLTADINMAGRIFKNAIIAADTDANTTFHGTPFTGTFDGNGHTIRHLTINSADNCYVGLFGMVNNGSIKNICLKDCNVSGTTFVGGLVGYNNKGTISNCDSNGIVNGSMTVGGLVGHNSGSISNCYSVCTISIAGVYAGGLVGLNVGGGNINNCHSTSTVHGSQYIGGMVGVNYSSSISNCNSMSNVYGGGYIGGLVGENYGGSSASISNCYSIDTVKGIYSSYYRYVGGLAGYNYGYISNCYSTSSVSGSSYVGGLVGYNTSGGNISNCYSIGTVNSGSYVGGLIGANSGNIVNSFWDVNSSGLKSSSGGTGKTTIEMQTLFTFKSAGWDFNTPVWKICDRTNYPKLAWQKASAGDFVCPDGVDISDLAVLSDQWLNAKLKYDLYKSDNLNIVNFMDWNIFANSWNGNIPSVAEFASEWLQTNTYDTDPASDINEDGIVNMSDFSIFAENWMME